MKRLWTKIGQWNPYWGVLTSSEYLTITPEKKSEFFQSGEIHVASVMNTLESHFGKDWNREKVLDFGCGVGRLVVPFAKRYRSTTGVDISSSMLAEAKKNCEEHQISNVIFCKTLSEDSSEQFDLVHSFIVLQHIPPEEGLKIIDRLLDRIKLGGRGMLHFTYENTFPPLKQGSLALRRNCSWFHIFCNVLQGRKWNMPHIPMYTYELSKVFALFHQKGIYEIHTKIEQHGAYRGLCCFFRRFV